MIKKETMGSYTDPNTGLKVIMVKTVDNKIRGIVNPKGVKNVK